MKNKKTYWIIFYTVLALAIDLAGRVFATHFTLPIWCDSIGTFLIAYIAGPVCGGIVGFTNNIIYGIFVEQQSVYCIVGALIGVLAGYFAKKKVFETQFATMTFGMCLALVSTAIAVAINTLLYDGQCGNVWGNQVMLMCMDSGLPRYLSYVIGQFCLEFLDKLLCVEIVYLLLRWNRRRKHKTAKKSKAIGVWLVCAVLAGIAAQPQTAAAKDDSSTDYDAYIQTVYSKEEGLLSGEANDIAQTKDGKLWIGTYAGLYKYDGSRFRLFQDINSVKNVNCLYVDEEGRLWVGTNDGGVTILINEKVMNVIDETSGLTSNSVKSIVCDTDGNYYIGTTEGLSIVSLSGGVRVTKSLEQIKNVIYMAADEDGNVVVNTDRGQMYWLNNGEIVDAPISVKQEQQFNTVFFSSDKRMFLGTSDNDVLVYDMSGNRPKYEKTIHLNGIEYINSFYETEIHEIFVCSDTGIAVLREDLSYKKLNTNNFTSSIDNMLVDYQGNLWFSSSRLGLLEMCKSPFQELFPEIGENEVVNTTQKWNDWLLCGTDDGIVIINENNTRKVENDITKQLQGVRVRCLKKDRENALWIATSGMGIYKIYEKQDNTFEIEQFTENDGLPGMRFRNILEAEDGSILVAGDYGVAVMKDGKVKDVYNAENGLLNEKSLCCLEYKGMYYIGSDGGGISQIKKDGSVKNITRKDGLSSGVILRMEYDPASDGVFIVTSNGLCYMQVDGTIQCLDNFPYSNNFDMVCSDDGTCWILSSAGIYIADSDNLIANQEREYPLINSKRGFRASLVANSWMCEEDNYLYLCCDSGVVKVNMKQYDMSAKSYRMVLDYAIVDGVKCAINRVDTLTLSAENEQLVFEPEVLNYSMNDPYISVYMIGYDKKEKVCLLSELDSVSYAKLKPGKYTFRISVLDGMEGNVVESASYSIKKENEMYQNWWFELYVWMIAALVLVWITWFITRTQTQKTLIKQKLELEYAKKQIKMGNETILSIARTVDAKDSNTSEHSFRVSQYSLAIAKRLGYSEEKCEHLRQMALLHDIGKIGIPDAILNKPGKLTDEEYEIMKTHVIRGGEILKDFTMIDNVNVGALYHHEKYDGSGYCHGLKGEQIPLDARIIGIADAFDAMTANRVYRKQQDLDFVIAELKRCSGTQFDPKLVDILLALIDEGEIDVKRLYAEPKEDR